MRSEGKWGNPPLQRLSPRRAIGRKLVPALGVNVELVKRLEDGATVPVVSQSKLLVCQVTDVIKANTNLATAACSSTMAAKLAALVYRLCVSSVSCQHIVCRDVHKDRQISEKFVCVMSAHCVSERAQGQANFGEILLKSEHTGKFSKKIRALRAQANFRSNFRKSLPGPTNRASHTNDQPCVSTNQHSSLNPNRQLQHRLTKPAPRFPRYPRCALLI